MARATAFGLVGGLLLAVVGAAPGSSEEPIDPGSVGGALIEVCAESPIPELPTIGPGVCTTIEAGAVLTALVCSKLPVPPDACADLTDGRVVDSALVDAYLDTWVPRALRLQAELDAPYPLRDALIPHTHNSFNARAYDINLATADPNHLYSITDQLRLGMRAIELDLHWFPHLSAGGSNAVVLCHGQVADVADLSIHVGCSVDRLLGPGLAEVADFLAAPGNEDELVLLYLQNELDADPAAHAAAIASIEEHLGDLIARPAGTTAGACADLPVERSRQSFLDAGHRVVLVGNCGPGAWSSWVYQRGAGWDERGNSAGYPDFPECLADREARQYDAKLIRVTEDRTWLSAITGAPAPISEPEVRAMVRCGVELIGLDRIGPTDPRLAALVWSWAPEEPSATGGHCAAWSDDARFRAESCDERLRVACRDGAGDWIVPEPAVPWTEGFALCESVDATFAVPPSGWQNELLRATALGDAVMAQAAAGPQPVLWLNLAETTGGWTPHLASAAQVLASPSGRSGPAAGAPSSPEQPASSPTERLPATGAPVAVLPTALLLALVLSLFGLRRHLST